MINKISFYGYFFSRSPEWIIRYDILYRGKTKFLLKYTLLDHDYNNPTQDVLVMVYQSLAQCIAAVVGRFRNLELEFGLYKPLTPEADLAKVYNELIREIEQTLSTSRTGSFSFFGNRKKYQSQSLVNKVLKEMGYLTMTTRKPYLYVLDDYVREEINLLLKIN